MVFCEKLIFRITQKILKPKKCIQWWSDSIFVRAFSSGSQSM